MLQSFLGRNVIKLLRNSPTRSSLVAMKLYGHVGSLVHGNLIKPTRKSQVMATTITWSAIGVHGLITIACVNNLLLGLSRVHSQILSPSLTLLLLCNFAPGRVRSIVVSIGPICLSVCLFFRIARKPHCQTSPIFCLMPMALARSYCGGVSIRYVLLVLWMASYFHTIGPVGQNRA